MAIGSNFVRRTPATLADLAQQYLAQPLPDISGIFQPVVDTPSPDIKLPIEETTPGITPQLLQSMGGDDFSVYNPDPNRIRTKDQYSPYAYRQAVERNLIGSGDSQFDINKYGTGYSSATEAQKFMDNYPDYYEGPQLTGIPGLIATYAKNSLPGRIIGGVANIANDILPVNRRAIIENEALGSGIILDDIGRIVQGSGDYNTGANVMAGYNLSQVTPETIQKRRDMINEKMKDPKQKAARLKALDDFEEMMFGTKGIKSKADLVFDDKSLQKDPTYQTLDELVAAGLAEGDDDDDDFSIEEFIAATNPNAIPTGITTASFPGVGLNRRNIVDIQDTKERIDRARERERQRAAEAAFAAAGGDRQQQAMQRARDQQAIDAANRAYRDDPGSYSGSYDPKDDTSYNDPFDPGGGE